MATKKKKGEELFRALVQQKDPEEQNQALKEVEELNRVLVQQKDPEEQNQALIELSRRIQDTVSNILVQRPYYSQEVLAIARLSLEPNMGINKAIALCDDVKDKLNRRAEG